MTTPQEANFPVHGDTPEKRREKVDTVFAISPMAGFLLSMVNFEWTLRRAILALGWNSTKNIREALAETHGDEKYKELWKEHVCTHCTERRPRLPALIREKSATDGRGKPIDWSEIVRAFNVRHMIVHGCSCTAGVAFLREKTDILLRASEVIVRFVAGNGGDIFRIIRRIKPRL